MYLLEKALRARVRLLATTLRPATVLQYNHTVRRFIHYMRNNFPQLQRADQLRRDPHMLGWLEYLWTRLGKHTGKPLCNHTRGAHVIRLRKLFDLLADHPFPPRPGLLLSQDIPPADHILPRPLTPEDDARLQTELQRRPDLLSSTLLLMRLTGMRIGEAVDLTQDCLHHLSDDQWAVHVPLGKLHTDRWVPVDEQAREVISRLQFLRTLLPQPASPEFLLPRPKGRSLLMEELRKALRQTATQAGITVHVVPHQLRHTYATTMLRAGISLPALMKLLGHKCANMTLRYVEITQKDLQREFQLARRNPRHLVPEPVCLPAPALEEIVPETVAGHLTSAIRVLELYRMSNPALDSRTLTLLGRRLVRIRGLFQKLVGGAKPEK